MGNCVSPRRKRSSPRVNSTTTDEIGNSPEDNSTEDSLPGASSLETIPSESESDPPAESSAPLLNNCPEPPSPPTVETPAENGAPLLNHCPESPSPPKVETPAESSSPLLNHCPETPSPPITSLCPRPVFGTNAEYELNLLKTAFNSAVKVDQQTGRIKFGSVQLVKETINRLTWLMDVALDNSELVIVCSHMETIKIILLACKAMYCQSNQDWSLGYALFQICIIVFCGDMESYSEYMYCSRGEIRLRDMHQMGVHKTITDCRNLAAHNSLDFPDIEELIRNVMKCLVWYGKYFWPNLWISRNSSGAQFLNYEFHFPKAKINNQIISGGLTITNNYSPSFDAFADSEEVQPGDIWLNGIPFR